VHVLESQIEIETKIVNDIDRWRKHKRQLWRKMSTSIWTDIQRFR